MISKSVQKILALITMNTQAYQNFMEKIGFFDRYSLDEVDISVLNFLKDNYSHHLGVMADFLSKRRSQNSQKYLSLFYKHIQSEKWLTLWESYLYSQIHMGMTSSKKEALQFSQFIQEQLIIDDLGKEILKFESKKLEVLDSAKYHIVQVNTQDHAEDSYPFINPSYQLVNFEYDILRITKDIQNSSINEHNYKKTQLLICSTWDGLNSVVLKPSSSLLTILNVCKGQNNIDSLRSLLKNIFNDQIDLVKDIFKPLVTARLMVFCSNRVS